MPWLRAHSTRRVSLAMFVGATLTIATTVGAKPNDAQLHASARDLLKVEVAPNPCDDVWQFLATETGSFGTPSGAVSIRQSYAVSGMSTLAPVHHDHAGRYAFNAPLMLDDNQLGRVDIRFARQPGLAETGFRYLVQVQTCDDASTCGRPDSRTSAPLECSARGDSATLVVPGASARQEVRIRFSR